MDNIKDMGITDRQIAEYNQARKMDVDDQEDPIQEPPTPKLQNKKQLSVTDLNKDTSAVWAKLDTNIHNNNYEACVPLLQNLLHRKDVNTDNKRILLIQFLDMLINQKKYYKPLIKYYINRS